MDDFDIPGISPEQKAAFENARAEKLKNAAIVKATFGTEDGKKCLAYLRSIYIENCKWNPKLEVLDSIRWGFIRQGQAMVVENIEDLINFFDKANKEQEENV